MGAVWVWSGCGVGMVWVRCGYGVWCGCGVDAVFGLAAVWMLYLV